MVTDSTKVQVDVDLEQDVDSAIQADLIVAEECDFDLNKDQGQTMAGVANIKADINSNQDNNVTSGQVDKDNSSNRQDKANKMDVIWRQLQVTIETRTIGMMTDVEDNEIAIGATCTMEKTCSAIISRTCTITTQ